LQVSSSRRTFRAADLRCEDGCFRPPCIVMGAMLRHLSEMYATGLDRRRGEVYAAATRERRMIQPMKTVSSSSIKTREVSEA
jgi:hypothetical protein